jgi:hypothetical protein
MTPARLLLLAVFAVLLVAPIKVAPPTLKRIAMTMWAVGGGSLTAMGVSRLLEAFQHNPALVNPMVLVPGLLAALVIGIVKGRTVLRKAALANIERLNAMAGPALLRQVYPLRSWILIAVMIGLAVALNVFNVDLFWRGIVNLGIGIALIIGSANYLQAPASVATSQPPQVAS